MTVFKPIKNRIKVRDAIASQVEESILAGHFSPDTRLPSETEMMGQFGASRNTVREALRMVEAAGMISIRRGGRGGAVVMRQSNQFVSDFLVKSLRLGGVSSDSVAQFRIALEPSIAAIVAQQGVTPEIDAQLEANIEDVKALNARNKVTGYKNMDFHVLLAKATANPMLIIILTTVKSSLDVITPILKIKRKVMSETIRHHEKILAAIRNGDPATARQQMEEHLADLCGALKQFE